MVIMLTSQRRLVLGCTFAVFTLLSLGLRSRDALGMHEGGAWTGSELSSPTGAPKQRRGVTQGPRQLSCDGSNKSRFFAGVQIPSHLRGRTICVTSNVTLTSGAAHLALLHEDDGEAIAVSEVAFPGDNAKFKSQMLVVPPRADGDAGDPWVGVSVFGGSEIIIESLEIRPLRMDAVDCSPGS